ncbi:60S ribosomal protein like [Actinidia chinensis var. chinensis]|uniref:60S ribosomal protein like n=1 Tax=Actinidia chinensis var. chinensis TaxID=1590841 RepID=A0A2R6PDA5_ACTCC|nr:60S ribosomal protein like [Actinidia chinensis var. chinensis]
MKQGRKRHKQAPLTLESKLLFIIRIGVKNDMHPTTRKFLYSLRLRRIFSGVFVKANERTVKILQRVQPYVTYGYPNLKSVKDLIYKKGLGKIEKQRVPLTDNNIIEQELGKYGILCIEDIVNEVAIVGPHFKEVTSFLSLHTQQDRNSTEGKEKA